MHYACSRQGSLVDTKHYGGIVRLACDRLREAGRDLDPVIGAGLTTEDVEDHKRRQHERSGHGAGPRRQTVARRLPRFPLARNFELGELGLVYYVMASSDRLVDALGNAERYCAINNEGVRSRICSERKLAIGFEYLNVDRPSDRHHMEFWLVTLVRICRTLTSSRLAPKQIKLRHFRPETPPDVRSHFKCGRIRGRDLTRYYFLRRLGRCRLLGPIFISTSFCFNMPTKLLASGRPGVPASGLMSRIRSHNCFRTAKLTRRRLPDALA